MAQYLKAQASSNLASLDIANLIATTFFQKRSAAINPPILEFRDVVFWVNYHCLKDKCIIICYIYLWFFIHVLENVLHEKCFKALYEKFDVFCYRICNYTCKYHTTHAF